MEARSTDQPKSPAGKRALVTGAATGLGREIALALVAAGYSVAAADRDFDGVETTAALAESGRIVPLWLELPDATSMAEAQEAAITALGGLDLLVNNAGISMPKAAMDLTTDEWDSVMDVNLKAAFFMSTGFARYRKGQGGGGAIVNLGSTHGIVGIAGRAAYGISKAGIIHMTKMLAIEWAPMGLRVNAVAPGTVLTPSREKLLSDPDKRQWMLGRIPTGQFITPADVAAAAVYLAGAEAGSVTGHTLVVDSGSTIW